MISVTAETRKYGPKIEKQKIDRCLLRGKRTK